MRWDRGRRKKKWIGGGLIGLVAAAAVLGVLNVVPSGFYREYRDNVAGRMARHSDTAILRETDMAGLPEPVRRYLGYTGAVGQPRVHSFRAVFHGAMKADPEGGWLTIRSEQVNFYGERARFFYIRSSMYGIPFDGYHRYSGNHATMRIKLAHLATVADAKGPEMDRGETVTLFNDMCLLAPATLADTSIRWRTLSDTVVMAVFTNAGQTIRAYLFFNRAGALVNFISFDRYLSSDGKQYLSYPWSTPVARYRNFGALKLASFGEAVWHTPRGRYAYARFNLAEVVINPLISP